MTDAMGRLVRVDEPDKDTGNLDGGGPVQPTSYDYRMTSAQDSTGGTTNYTYDADGRRVRRSISGQPEVWQVYGLGGELLAEYAANTDHLSPQKEYGYRNGQLLGEERDSGAGDQIGFRH